MNRVVTVLSIGFGYMFLGLSFFVTAETIMRKVFNVSFQGADELGGYALAVGSSLAFSIALVRRSHIRIDLLHVHLPLRVQAFLNWLAALLLGGLGVFLAVFCLKIIRDTLLYRSTAPTPWTTPLIYPQSVWFACLTIFAAVGVWLALRATFLLLAGRVNDLNREFQPKGVVDELREELQDIGHRKKGGPERPDVSAGEPDTSLL